MSSRQRHFQETRNAAEVMLWIEHLAVHPEVPIDLDLICHINRLTLRGTDRDYWAGRIRSEVNWQQPEDWTRPRALVALEEEGLAVAHEKTGEVLLRFPPDREVGPLMDELIAWVHSSAAYELHPIVRAAIFHQRLTAIHPFRDGNGRTARALTTLILWRAGYPLEVLLLQRVLDEQRDAYIEALRQADAGALAGWIQFFGQAVLTALQSAKR